MGGKSTLVLMHFSLHSGHPIACLAVPPLRSNLMKQFYQSQMWWALTCAFHWVMAEAGDMMCQNAKYECKDVFEMLQLVIMSGGACKNANDSKLWAERSYFVRFWDLFADVAVMYRKKRLQVVFTCVSQFLHCKTARIGLEITRCEWNGIFKVLQSAMLRSWWDHNANAPKWWGGRWVISYIFRYVILLF